MRRLEQRAAELARAEQRRRIGRLAARMGDMLRSARIETDGNRLIVSGRGLVRRWLADPGLRFLGRSGQ